VGELVRLEVDEASRVGTIRLDRPPVNALNAQIQVELLAAAEEAGRDERVGAVVLWGGEKVFAAGADIKEMDGLGFAGISTRPTDLADACDALAGIPKVVIAAVNGYALGGGCEVALTADFRFAAEDATFGQPEILLGIIPGAGGTQRLARTAGKQIAMELVLTGRRIDAAEAHRIGIVNQVASKGEWLDKAVELASVVARRPPIAARLGKQAVLAAEETAMTAGLDHERRLYELAMATEDRVEGMTAFIEKRKPEFKGH
jgi:enoyl-CoA hydratase/carnithine racemase